MITKLPRWVWCVAWLLAFVAGVINITGLLSFERQAVTHLTGTTSALGDALALARWSEVLRVSLVAFSFVAGSAVSGFLVKDSTLKLRRSYGIVFGLESVLLIVAIPFLQRQLHAGICLASAACGLQNALATTYSGATIRTTHVSGMFTDLGLYLGHVIRGVAVDIRRLKLCVIIISGFLLGGVAGGSAFRAWGCLTLLGPAAVAGALAAVCASRKWASFL